MPIFQVRHKTSYRYDQPVALGPQRLVLRPRDSHDLRLLDATLSVRPAPARTRWLYDVYDNSIAILDFAGPAEELTIESRLLIDHLGFDRPRLPVEPFAESWPFSYRVEEQGDLGPWTRRQFDDPDGRLARWVRQLVLDRLELPTQELLVALMRKVREELPYSERDEEGIRSPAETLARGGSCRDFAVLMIEAARILGFAARFVSGYLYVPPAGTLPAASAAAGTVGADIAAAPYRGGGSTHAWVQVYLPGAGWVEFDPTNGIYGGADLFRVAIAREPALVSPVSGSFKGTPGTRSTLLVEVEVTRHDDLATLA